MQTPPVITLGLLRSIGSPRALSCFLLTPLAGVTSTVAALGLVLTAAAFTIAISTTDTALFGTFVMAAASWTGVALVYASLHVRTLRALRRTGCDACPHCLHDLRSHDKNAPCPGCGHDIPVDRVELWRLARAQAGVWPRHHAAPLRTGRRLVAIGAAAMLASMALLALHDHTGVLYTLGLGTTAELVLLNVASVGGVCFVVGMIACLYRLVRVPPSPPAFN